MRTLVLFFAISLLNQLNAQKRHYEGPEVRDAQFADTFALLSQYFSQHLRYPEAAAMRHIEGVVVVTFTVNADGTIGQAKVRHGLGHGCDEEALRLVQAMPPWQPATLDGKPVACGKTVRIEFRAGKKSLARSL
ncbi:MAG: energy transducer TonB [Saprospiraceae bacterium]|nr:energy transducer TonB [Saprospiraceae bacterium]